MADMICSECGRDCSKYKPDDFSGLCIECEYANQIGGTGMLMGDPQGLVDLDAAADLMDEDEVEELGGIVERRIPVRSYEEAVRDVRGKSVEDLLGQATRRLSAKPEEVGESEGEKLDAEIDATVAHAGAQCPNCGAPDLQVVELTNGNSYFECMACAFASEPTATESGPTAWLIEDGEHTLPCCSDLCAKVGAARVGGRVVGERPWGNPESLCFACEQPLEG